MKMNICFEPNKIDLQKILVWLKEEHANNKYGLGFYNDRNILEEAFVKEKLILIKHDDFPVGFITYSSYEQIVTIDIMSVKEDYQLHGIGKKLIDASLNLFKNKNQLAIELYCQPANSEGFWRKMGFKNFPSIRFNNKKIYMYYTLVKTAKEVKVIGSDYKMELWNVEPYTSEEVNPKWTWELELDTNNQLINPVIFPIDFDWYVKITYQNQIIEEHKAKYCKNVKLLRGHYLFINEILH